MRAHSYTGAHKWIPEGSLPRPLPAWAGLPLKQGLYKDQPVILIAPTLSQRVHRVPCRNHLHRTLSCTHNQEARVHWDQNTGDGATKAQCLPDAPLGPAARRRPPCQETPPPGAYWTVVAGTARPGRICQACQRGAHLHGVGPHRLCHKTTPGRLRPAAGAGPWLGHASVATWTHHPPGPRGPPSLLPTWTAWVLARRHAGGRCP